MVKSPKKNAKQRRRRDTATGHKAGASTHDALLKAGEVIFARKGFECTTVHDIAALAGVNVSLVSYHFGGKKGLYLACLERFGTARLSAVRKLLQPCEDFSEFRIRLKIFANEFFDSHLENKDLVTIIHREVLSGLPNAPETFQKTYLRIFETIVDFFGDAQTKKIIRKDAVPLVVAGTMYGSMVHALTNDHISHKFFKTSLTMKPHRLTFIDQLMISFVDGLHPDAATFPRSK